jgi:hypothetical protein
MIKPLLTSTGHAITDQYGMPLYEESSLVTPAGIGDGTGFCGALLSPEPPGAIGPLFRDAFPKEIIDPSDWKPLIDNGEGNHRQYVRWILDQNGHGSCAAEGVINCYTTQRHRRGFEEIKFNPWPTYYFSGGGRDNGSSLYANVREGQTRGFVPMDLWPRYGAGAHRWNDIPPSSSPIWDEAKKYRLNEVYEIGNAIEAASALFKGHTVYAAYPGHAWELLSVLNSSQFEWLNSWGASWDGDGIGVIAASRITWQYGVYAIATGTEGT